jgi:hypothetical protein
VFHPLRFILRLFATISGFAAVGVFWGTPLNVLAQDSIAEKGTLAFSITLPEGKTTIRDLHNYVIRAALRREWKVIQEENERIVIYLLHRKQEATVTFLITDHSVEAYCVGYQVDNAGERKAPEQPTRWLNYLKADIAKYASETTGPDGAGGRPSEPTPGPTANPPTPGTPETAAPRSNVAANNPVRRPAQGPSDDRWLAIAAEVPGSNVTLELSTTNEGLGLLKWSDRKGQVVGLLIHRALGPISDKGLILVSDSGQAMYFFKESISLQDLQRDNGLQPGYYAIRVTIGSYSDHQGDSSNWITVKIE